VLAAHGAGEQPRPPAEEGQCSPPSGHTRRMIGMGMPINHNSRPRPICNSFCLSRARRETPPEFLQFNDGRGRSEFHAIL